MRWDVFISHATEDKRLVAEPLAQALKDAGLSVWYDQFELRLGDRLRRSIDEGVRNSRFGIVVLSPSFFIKHWTQLELDGLAQREESGEKVILPIWYNISVEEVRKYSILLADRIALRWTDGLHKIVTEVLSVVVDSSKDTFLGRRAAVEQSRVDSRNTQTASTSFTSRPIGIKPSNTLEKTETINSERIYDSNGNCNLSGNESGDYFDNLDGWHTKMPTHVD
jgi:TIR domain-containing protein